MAQGKGFATDCVLNDTENSLTPDSSFNISLAGNGASRT